MSKPKNRRYAVVPVKKKFVSEEEKLEMIKRNFYEERAQLRIKEAKDEIDRIKRAREDEIARMNSYERKKIISEKRKGINAFRVNTRRNRLQKDRNKRRYNSIIRELNSDQKKALVESYANRQGAKERYDYLIDKQRNLDNQQLRQSYANRAAAEERANIAITEKIRRDMEREEAEITRRQRESVMAERERTNARNERIRREIEEERQEQERQRREEQERQRREKARKDFDDYFRRRRQYEEEERREEERREEERRDDERRERAREEERRERVRDEERRRTRERRHNESRRDVPQQVENSHAPLRGQIRALFQKYPGPYENCKIQNVNDTENDIIQFVNSTPTNKKKMYGKINLKYHPDKNIGCKDLSKDIIQIINNIYEIGKGKGRVTRRRL